MSAAVSDALAAAAQALSAPEAIVRRSAEARAKVTGVSVDDILTAWAGGTVVTASPAAPKRASKAAGISASAGLRTPKPR